MDVTGEIWHWRGPAPFHFVTVPEPQAAEIAAIARDVTYGWGMIPVELRVGRTRWTTSLWPREGGYVVPIKDAVRAAEHLELGDTVTVHLEVAPRGGRR
ncbi:DUF1905 domain-containing protein [Actinotalea sp. M2MS4P-6]|uniref:DUF1905 domain-containing protein n=1 Tax=Actinotalea sp. M2MS4P-6 TaxID=2983762 RepID=UPI0021E37E19|nr:DUF1905 domain-containing protein [Actinotalea sp. M2MS4P-6]MCV2392876.1 DUF1905 domain-containing protein [Actinotalea sp. M2MS4P-6]